MWASRVLAERFKGVRCTSVHELLSHAQAVSTQIKPKPQVQKPLSSFTVQVLELAPSFLRGQYRRQALVLALLERHGKKLTNEELRKMYRKVNGALTLLKGRGLIPATSAQDRPRRLLPLREATAAEIQRGIRLVHFVLRKGHGFLPGNWRHYLSYAEALQVGKRGLVWAIETHDPEKRAFSTHATGLIAAEISHELDKIRPRKRKAKPSEMSFSSSVETLDEHRGEVSPLNLEPLLKSGEVGSHHLILWSLNRVFGHSVREIGTHFGVNQVAVWRLVKKTDAALRAINEH